MKKRNNKALAVLMLSLISIGLPAMADTITSGKVLDTVNGNYGADLRDVTGATIDSDYTNAIIKNTQTNSVLNWNNLNTAPNQSLTFIMKNGETSLNNVVGTSLSKFAGSLTAENGRVIISNPNGMIFENGAYVNANALTLTTHNAFIENGNLRLLSSDNNASIKFNGGNSAINLKIAKDLNIISSNIEINNANLLAQDTRLVTADGVTFFAINNNNTSNFKTQNVATSENANIGSLNINNSTFAVKDKNTGKISIVSKGNVDTKKVAFDSDVDIKTNKALTMKSTQFKTIKAAAADIKFNNMEVNNADVKATNKITASSLNINNSTLDGKTVEVSHATVKNSTLKATNLNALASNISNSNAEVRNNIYTTTKPEDGYVGSTITNSTLTAGNEMRLANAKLDNVRINSKSVKINDAKLLNGTSLTTKTIADNGNNVVINKSSLNVTNGNVTLKKAVLENANISTPNGNIYLESENVISGTYNAKGNFQAKSSNWKKQLAFDNANVTAGDYIKLMSNPIVSNSKFTTNGTITAQKSAISNSEILAKTLYGQDSTIKDSIINATNDIIVSNSNIANSSLIATKDLKLENTNLNKVSANGRYAFLNNAVLENNTNLTANRLSSQGTNDYQTGNIVYKAGMTVENLTIKNSTMKVKDDVYLKNAILDNATIETAIGKDLNIDTNSDIKLTGINIGGNLNITKAGNVTISNSQISGDKYIPSLAPGKKSVTDYDRTKYNEDYFQNIINNYGEDYGNNTKISIINGDINIKNANSSTIINSIVGGDLTTENCVGSNIITSLVEGNYNPDRAQTEVSVYKSFIGGDYNNQYDNQLSSANASSIDTSRYDDHNRRKFGNEINSQFEKRFSPRGFAASEDEVSQMKSEVKSVKVGNKIKVSKDFHAY